MSHQVGGAGGGAAGGPGTEPATPSGGSPAAPGHSAGMHRVLKKFSISTLQAHNENMKKKSKE